MKTDNIQDGGRWPYTEKSLFWP